MTVLRMGAGAGLAGPGIWGGKELESESFKQSVSSGRGAAHGGTWGLFLPREVAGSAPGCLYCPTVLLLADVCPLWASSPHPHHGGSPQALTGRPFANCKVLCTTR